MHVISELVTNKLSYPRLGKKVKGPVLDIALLHDEHMLTLQSRKWQLIGMS